MPISRANAKSFSVSPPNTNRLAIGSSVMMLVFSERVSVSHSEMFTIWPYVCRRSRRSFSRTRSNTMIVSYSE